jgi:hypothetical protein
MYSAEVIIEHLAQKLFAFERVACEMEANGAADGAGTIKEIIFRLGIYDQPRVIHATMMPQSEMPKRDCGFSN